MTELMWLGPEGERIIAQEITTAMNIITRYKPLQHGGEANAWDDYHQMAEDVVHLSALLVSISPLAGHLAGNETLADYRREIERDAAYTNIKSIRDPVTNKVPSDDMATRMARTRVAELYIEHGVSVRTSEKVRALTYAMRDMIETLNRTLDRQSRERRSNG